MNTSERQNLLKLLCDKGGKLNILKTMTDEQLTEVSHLVSLVQDLIRGDQRRPQPVTADEVGRAATVEKMSERRRDEFQRDLLRLSNEDFAVKYPRK